MISLLTVIPVGRRTIDLAPRDIGRAMSLAPLVAVMLWLPAAGLQLGARLLLNDNSTLVVPLVSLGFIALATGCLHLDGLADLADGLGSRKSGAAALAVMKEPAIGAIGAIALIFVVLAEAGSLSVAIDRRHGTVALLTSQIAGRLAIVLACRTGIPAARTNGMGVQVIGTVSRWRAATTALAVFAVAAIAGKLDYDGGRFKESAHAMFAVLCGLVAAEVVRRIAVRRLGGMTGDVFGALLEVAVLVDLVVMSASTPTWLH